MKYSRYRTTTLLLILAISSLLGAQTRDDEVFEADRRAAFARIDEVLPWDTSALTFVVERPLEVDAGRPWTIRRRIGFIVRDSRSHVTVRLVDGGIIHIDANRSHGPGEIYVRHVALQKPPRVDPLGQFEAADMGEFASTLIDMLLAGRRTYARSSEPCSLTLDELALLLARYASQRGLEEVSRSLCRAILGRPRRTEEQMRQTADSHREIVTKDPPSTGVREQWPEAALLRRVNESVESIADWRDAMDFEDPTLSWSDLLERHERFVKQFPNSEMAPVHLHRIAGLRCRKEEDTRHRSEGRPMSFDTQFATADLVRLLRDDFDGRVSDELVRRDLEVVPLLLPLLTDTLPARRANVEVVPWIGTIHYVLSVSSLADEVLGRIFGHQYPVTENDHDLAAYWQRWFDEVTLNGEKETLLNAVRSFDHRSYGSAQRLVARHPESAIDLARLLETCPTENDRCGILAALSNSMDPHVLEVLERHLKGASTLTSSTLAAQILCRNGRAAGLDYLLDPGGRSERSESRPHPGFFFGTVSALLESGTPRAVDAIVDALRDLDATRRFAVLDGIREFLATHTDNAGKVPPQVESSLLACLDDVEPRRPFFWSGWQHSRTGRYETLSAPSVAEVAASTLNWISEERYPFDVTAPRRARLAAIVALRVSAGGLTTTEATPTTPSTGREDQATCDHITTVSILPPSDVSSEAGRRLLAMRGHVIDTAAIAGAFEVAVREASSPTSKVLMTIDRKARGDGIAVSFERYDTPKEWNYSGYDWHLSLSLDGLMLDSATSGRTNSSLESVHEFGKRVAGDLDHLIATPDAPPFEAFVLATF